MTLIVFGGSLPIICMWLSTILADWLRLTGLAVHAI
jgi:hypothetical protein